jgi:hypothetical protein
VIMSEITITDIEEQYARAVRQRIAAYDRLHDLSESLAAAEEEWRRAEDNERTVKEKLLNLICEICRG